MRVIPLQIRPQGLINDCDSCGVGYSFQPFKSFVSHVPIHTAGHGHDALRVELCQLILVTMLGKGVTFIIERSANKLLLVFTIVDSKGTRA